MSNVSSPIEMPGSSVTIQHGHDLEKPAESQKTLDFMRKCLVECDLHHTGCKPLRLDAGPASEDVSNPSRLIEVSKNNELRVRIVEGVKESVRYAALSHRWVSGPMPAWVTRRDTLDPRCTWFQADFLSASILDAIKITRRIDLDYVWIDSLCIIQDSADDWNREAGKMANVYAHAYVTLFADRAEDDNHGFLAPREVFSSTSIPLRRENDSPVNIRVRKSSTDTWKYPQGALFTSDTKESSSLSERAWILQERILSRRKLHFGSHQVYWMCREHVVAEDGDVPNMWSSNDELDVYNMMRASEVTERTLQYGWQALVTLYSSLQLTYTEDKLPALSGLAKVFGIISRRDYIAGIWKQSFATDLAWYVGIKDPDEKSFRPASYRAPSFSWASVDDQIRLKKFDAEDRNSPDVVDVALTSCDIDLVGTDLFGKVRSGMIVLHGLTRKAIHIGPYTTAIRDTDKEYHPLYNLEMAPIGSMHSDTREEIPHGAVTCLKLFGGTIDVFLVLLPVSPEDEDCNIFKRVGLGDTLMWRRSVYGDEKFFDGAARETIVIM